MAPSGAIIAARESNNRDMSGSEITFRLMHREGKYFSNIRSDPTAGVCIPASGALQTYVRA